MVRVPNSSSPGPWSSLAQAAKRLLNSRRFPFSKKEKNPSCLGGHSLRSDSLKGGSSHSESPNGGKAGPSAQPPFRRPRVTVEDLRPSPEASPSPSVGLVKRAETTSSEISKDADPSTSEVCPQCSSSGELHWFYAISVDLTSLTTLVPALVLILITGYWLSLSWAEGLSFALIFSVPIMFGYSKRGLCERCLDDLSGGKSFIALKEEVRPPGDPEDEASFGNKVRKEKAATSNDMEARKNSDLHEIAEGKKIVGLTEISPPKNQSEKSTSQDS